jgi:hypothetical protein
MTSKKDFIRSRQEFSDRISRASVSVSEPSLSHQASASTLPRKRSAPTTNESKKNKKKREITSNDKVFKSIDRKLDQLLAGQRSLEERVINLEESLKNSNTRFNAKDVPFVKVNYKNFFYCNFIYIRMT